VSRDTLHIGKLKGTGEVWRITACDAVSSYGVAWCLPELSAEAALAFLPGILVPSVDGRAVHGRAPTSWSRAAAGSTHAPLWDRERVNTLSGFGAELLNG
jgi:hypothetical protein